MPKQQPSTSTRFAEMPPTQFSAATFNPQMRTLCCCASASSSSSAHSLVIDDLCCCKERRTDTTTMTERTNRQNFARLNNTGLCSSSRSSSWRSSSAHPPSLFSVPIFLLLVVLLQSLLLFDRSTAVRCYCTDEHCVPYGVCEAAVCLVGLLRANNAVIRTCGNEPLGCQRNLNRWSHICSCEEHFCNTFLFLKASTSIDGGARGRGDGGGAAAPAAGRHHQPRQQSLQGDDDDAGDEHRVFQRVDPPPGDFATFEDPSFDDDEERGIKNSNLLTLLLVLVPLSVGSAAVVVVAFNYYCHLC